MQRDSRGSIASLTPQIGLHLGFAGECPDDGSANGRRGTGRSPANPKLLDGLGKPIWGAREAIVPLLSFCIPFLSPYYPLIILLHRVI